jgi:alkyl sulfatase BDS1-like metallo-beta-lactamase superfamily hydrolase
MDTSEKAASAAVAAQQQALRESLPFHDERDLESATRGLIGRRASGVVTAEDGRVVWDNDGYSFLTGDAPDTVNPSLWRQSTLVAEQGLFEVVPGIYQVRGLDLSNMTVVEGDTGVLVIDPLISVETAAAGLALYREHRGDRPVTGVLYTHSHVDHFGGVKGVTTQEEVDAGRVPVIAPEGFMDHAIEENVYAGTAMTRRAGYMYGASLPRGVRGQVGAGLGQTTSTGSVTLIPPTVDITTTGQELTVDGIRMVFQMAPGTEAPAEMHFFFPDHGALCMAENATHTLHNILTLRGAVVRDAHAWSSYLTEAIDLFGADATVAFASHHWPTWGNDEVVGYLELQRDLYAYLHDQTLRMLNQGMTGEEIAEAMTMPPALEDAWHTRGYYGSVSHNVKAVYQRYMGWYTGNPSQLWKHPPVESARRYVEFMGGSDAVVAKARVSFAAGDLRWVAEVLNHVVFADQSHEGARELLADTYEQLGYGAENGTWRSAYLSGAHELRHGSFGTPASMGSADMMGALTAAQLLDSLAIRVDGPRAWALHVTFDWVVPDTGQRFRVQLRHGVLTYSTFPQRAAAQAVVTASRAGLIGLMAGGGNAGVEVVGDQHAVATLLTVLDAGDPNFAIVTP